MRSRILLCGALAMAFISGCKEEQKISPNPMGLKGNVKSLHSQTYDASVVFDNVMEERIWNEFYKFNRNGCLTEQKSFDIDDRLSCRSVHKYVGGNCVRETNYNCEGDIESENFSKYDRSGNKTEEVRKDENGNIACRNEYEYDQQGRVSQHITFDASGKFAEKRVYEYNENGDVLSETVLDEQNQELGRRQTVYHANGLVQETADYYKGDLTSKVLYEYDEKGLLLSTLTIPYGAEYVAEAKCVYEYDNHDNWIKETIYDVKKNQTRFVTKRDIVYY